MKYDVFISYRRDVSTQHALALRTSLESLQRYKDRVFMDTHTLKSGNFIEKLNEKIRESCNFVVIFSKGCFDQNKKKPGEMDYFLYEISQALKYGMSVIPIYYDGLKYNDIKNFLHEDRLIDFPKQNSIFFHNDDPEGSIAQIISFLKSEEEVLTERYSYLSKEKKAVRQKILYLRKDCNESTCPICKKTYSAIQSYCLECGFKFFDELEESVSETSDLIQESDRKKKHELLWKKNLRNNDFVLIEQQYGTDQESIARLEKLVEQEKEEKQKLKAVISEDKEKIKTLEAQIRQLEEQSLHDSKKIRTLEKEKESLNSKLYQLEKDKSVDNSPSSSTQIPPNSPSSSTQIPPTMGKDMMKLAALYALSPLLQNYLPQKKNSATQHRKTIHEYEWHQIIQECKKESTIFEYHRIIDVLDIEKLIIALTKYNVSVDFEKMIETCNTVGDLKKYLVHKQ